MLSSTNLVIYLLYIGIDRDVYDHMAAYQAKLTLMTGTEDFQVLDYMLPVAQHFHFHFTTSFEE